MKIVSALVAVTISAGCGLAMLGSAHAAPVSQMIPARSEWGNAGANTLQLVQSDHLMTPDQSQSRGGRYRGESEGYGRRPYGEQRGYGYGYGGSAHDRRMQIIWCTQHPGRC
jgi:hypothetical protein